MSGSQTFSEGDRVEWDWGDGTASGKITQIYTQRQTLTIKGTNVTRDASADCPAYRIDTDDSEALKTHSEVRRA